MVQSKKPPVAGPSPGTSANSTEQPERKGARPANRQANRLINETSPYLLQHAHNPVDWYPWGEETLLRAKVESKPILLSIGYSACHWCHVMERESFENETTATIMNDHFVSIKVDREERPDLDAVYMAATQTLNRGQGGWPMTVFLTPQGEPFFAGTYFPPEDRYGRPGFPSLLRSIAKLWQEDREKLVEQAGRLTEHLQGTARAPEPAVVNKDQLKGTLDQFKERFDHLHGGFGPAPKFPQPASLSLLFRLYHRTQDVSALMIAERTLEAMARGGIYDHIGGGFFRYSTDARWLVPHFEKMLYDNAQLARIYLEAYQVTGKELYRKVATETLDYLMGEMISPAGGFYAATDADSEGVEGRYFVWTPDEIEAILGPKVSRQFCAYHDITPTGNWEGRSIPNVPLPLADVARTLKIDEDELMMNLESTRKKVYEARLERVAPGLDDKVLTSWNGLALSALAEGYRVLGDRRYLRGASRAAEFLLTTMMFDEHENEREHQAEGQRRLMRVWCKDRVSQAGFLEDHAYLAQGLIDLYEAGGERRWLDEAMGLAGVIIDDFLDPAGGAFFTISNDHEQLIVREVEGTDGATPSANSVAASVLACLSYHFDDEQLNTAAEKALAPFGQRMVAMPLAFASGLSAMDLLLHGGVELTLAGKPGESDYEAIRERINSVHIPNRIIRYRDPSRANASEQTKVTDKELVDGKAALYVCKDQTCLEPICDPEVVDRVLKDLAITSS